MALTLNKAKNSNTSYYNTSNTKVKDFRIPSTPAFGTSPKIQIYALNSHEEKNSQIFFTLLCIAVALYTNNLRQYCCHKGDTIVTFPLLFVA